jgi:hypothetical protein
MSCQSIPTPFSFCSEFLQPAAPLSKSLIAKFDLSFTLFSVIVTVSFNRSGSFLMNRQLRYRCRALNRGLKKTDYALERAQEEPGTP